MLLLDRRVQVAPLKNQKVIEAIGAPDDGEWGTVRFSFARTTTSQELKETVEVFRGCFYNDCASFRHDRFCIDLTKIATLCFALLAQLAEQLALNQLGCRFEPCTGHLKIDLFTLCE